jgi:hypothetical protein
LAADDQTEEQYSKNGKIKLRKQVRFVDELPKIEDALRSNPNLRDAIEQMVRK